jgi:hypothetical protein
MKKGLAIRDFIFRQFVDKVRLFFQLGKIFSAQLLALAVPGSATVL